MTIINDIDTNVIDALDEVGQLDKSIVLENMDYRKLIKKYDRGSGSVF